MAAPVADVSRTLKEALFETLNAILSPSHDVRISAEEQLKVLEVTDEFGVHLAELTVDRNGILPIRQLASVLLKQYVACHWSSCSEKFRPPATTDEAKAAIRNLLPLGLNESISKVRSSIAYAISAIAHWDWPESWPQLFEILMHSLTSNDSNAVHGAMRVLTEFCRDVTDIQMPGVAPVVLPEMYKIFTEPEKYSIRTRGRAVEIFSTCAQMITMMVYCNKGIVKTLLYPVLPKFCEALVAALQVPDGKTSDSGLKKEVLKALTVLVKNIPKQMSSWLPHILNPVWNALTESASIYVRTVVNDTEEADNPVDSDGEVLGFENLVFSIFEFVVALVETPKFQGLVKKGMADLLYYTVLYMQITEDQIRQWSNNPDQFVEDEDDDRYSYSVRISAQDLLLLLCQEFEDETASGLCIAITKHLQEAEACKNAGNPYWWKIHESCMLAFGSIKDLIVDQIQNNNLQFNLIGFLQSVVLADLNTCVSPFLIGRCLWTSSRFAVVMNPDLTEKFIQSTLNGLHMSQPSTIRVSSVRAVWGFCVHLKNSQQTSYLVSYLTPIMDGLLTLATQFSSEVLALVLEVITTVLSVDKNFTATVEAKVAPLAISVFLKYNSDPILVSLAQDIFKELCNNPLCQAPLQQRLLPTLVSILQAPPMKIPLGLQAVALDVLQTLVRSSSVPLLDWLVTQGFPAAIHCILNTDDNTSLQNGGECIRAYVSVGLDQLNAWRDEAGNGGLYYVVKVAQHLLDPKTSESSAAFVGRLISTVIAKAGSLLGENTDVLLRAVLSKLQQTESLSVTQSLVMVFAHLVHSQMDAVLEFLSSVPGPTGKSALQYVLTVWCSCQHLFFGVYENKVSILALCKLLEYGLKSNDKRLTEIQVNGELLFNPRASAGVRTRSASLRKPDEWTRIPLLVKMYKLLVYELSVVMEQANATEEDDDDDDEDLDAEEWEDEKTQEESGDTAMPLSNVLSEFAAASDYQGYDTFLDDDDYDDPDAPSDPIYHVNLRPVLTQFLQSLSQQPCYSSFSHHLTSQERQTLVLIGINAG